MGGSKINITEFSKHIGISISTVSRALNGYDDVNSETRNKIELAARELGYVPNAASRRLRKKNQIENIGFLTPKDAKNFINPVFLQTLTGIDEVLSEQGLNLSIHSFNRNQNEIDEIERLIAAGSVDAIILTRTLRYDNRINYLVRSRVPFICLGYSDIEVDFSYVEIDHYSAAKISVEHLYKFGHQRIALLNGPEKYMLNWRRRCGFEDTLRGFNLESDPALIIQTRSFNEGFKVAIEELLDLPDPPTAIICASDFIAFRVYDVALERGLTIGKQLSVVGCDDVLGSRSMSPPLTSVTANRTQAGRCLALGLLEVARGKTTENIQKTFSMNLVERRSVQERV